MSKAIQTYPLPQMDLAMATAAQFRLVDIMHRHFDGREILQAGDLGVNPAYGQPHFAAKVEAVLADFFEAEAAMLVRGAGTGAIRAVLMANLSPGDAVLVHDAPVYATTSTTFRAMGLKLVRADFNNLETVKRRLIPHIKWAVIQHSRQLLPDRYELAAVIQTIREVAPQVHILVDDNYTTLNVPKIGCQVGATLSAFSLFKLLGPPGVGCVVGCADQIAPMRADAYSGGSKVQGSEALDALKSLVFAPVMLAITAQTVDELASRLNAGEVAGVAEAFVANHQARSLLVRLERPYMTQVVETAVQYGAAPFPIGAASRYEVNAMFYRSSGAMRQAYPELADHLLRINPFRSSADTVIRILKSSLEAIND